MAFKHLNWVFLSAFGLFLAACTQSPYDNYPTYDPKQAHYMAPINPKQDILGYLGTAKIGINDWEVANMTEPKLTPNGYEVDADVRFRRRMTLSGAPEPWSEWSRHRFLLDAGVKSASPPIPLT